MKSSLRALLLCSLFVSALAVAQGPDTNKVVCGDKIHLQTAFAKVTVNPEAPRVTYEALEAALAARVSRWPAAVRDKVDGAYSAMLEGGFAPADFRIEDVGTGIRQTQMAFPATAFQLQLPKEAGDALCSNGQEKAARKEAAEFVSTVAGAFGQLKAEDFRLAATQIGALEKLYDKYLFEGFPMFPWEAAVNSWLLTNERIADGPPRDAIVFLHPAAGVVSSVDSNSRSDLGGVLSVEPLGWVRYSDDYKSWYGVSLLAVFPSDREVGYGVALNYRNFKLGVTYHDDDEGQYDGAAIFFGMDLYQFLGEKQRSYQGYLEAVKKLKP